MQIILFVSVIPGSPAFSVEHPLTPTYRRQVKATKLNLPQNNLPITYNKKMFCPFFENTLTFKRSKQL